MAGKLKATGLLALMFVLGVVSGIAWQVHVFRHGPPRWAHAERRIARLRKDLHLTAWQEQTIKDIIQDARERANDIHDGMNLDMAQIHQDSINAIQQMLTPDQQQQFEKMHKRHHPHWGEAQPSPLAENDPGAG